MGQMMASPESPSTECSSHPAGFKESVVSFECVCDVVDNVLQKD